MTAHNTKLSRDSYIFSSMELVAERHKRQSGQNFRFEVTNDFPDTLTAVVTRMDKNEFRIALDENLAHNLRLLIRCVMCQEAFLPVSADTGIPLESEKFKGTMLSVSEEDRKTCRLLLKNITKNVGIEKLFIFNNENGHVLCNLASDLAALNRLEWHVIELASSSALLFLLQHEFSHIAGRHSEMLDILSASTMRDGTTFCNADDVKSLEILADANAAANMFVLVSCQADNFRKAPLSYNLESAIYLTGVSFGVGIAIYLLMIDAAYGVDSSHAAASERLFWISKWMIASCPKEKGPSDDEGGKIERSYHRGAFDGAKAAIKLWDKAGLSKNPNKELDQFLATDLGCPICEDNAGNLLAVMKSKSSYFINLERRMRQAGFIFDKRRSMWSMNIRPLDFVQSVRNSSKNIRRLRAEYEARFGPRWPPG